MISSRATLTTCRRYIGLGVLALVVAPQAAGAIEIRLELMGQAGLEDPKFDVLVNNAVVGGGTVVLAAKSANGEYLTDGTEFYPYVQRYAFRAEVSDAAPVRVGVRFLNDFFDGDKGLDANLYVVSVTVDGKALDLAEVEVQGAQDEPRDAMFWRGVLMLPWYATASLTYPDDIAATSQLEATAGPVGSPASTLPDEAADTSAASEAALAADVAVAPPEPGAPTCAATGTIAIIYPNGEAALSAEGRSALDDLIAGGLAGCSIDVAGYSSPGGPVDINLVVSQARAAEVEAYLRKKVPEGLSLTVEGKGATDQFGAGAENRRVVVTIE